MTEAISEWSGPTSGWPTVSKSSLIERRYTSCAGRQLTTQSCWRQHLNVAIEAKQQARCVLHAFDPDGRGAPALGIGPGGADYLGNIRTQPAEARQCRFVNADGGTVAHKLASKRATSCCQTWAKLKVRHWTFRFARIRTL